MIQTAMKTKGAVNHSSLSTINDHKLQRTFSAQNLLSLNQPIVNRPAANQGKPVQPHRPMAANTAGHPQTSSYTGSKNRQPQPAGHPASIIPGTQADAAAPAPLNSQRPMPRLVRQIQKGQKTTLAPDGSLGCIRACFGWNTSNPQCDVDVSAFLLGADGKTLGDSWFVFYGQTASPDGSCMFLPGGAVDREIIQVDFKRLNGGVKKIVFVLTINDAFAKRLHFGMLKDAYVRILQGQEELASFQMADYYENVISMMIGEIYEYKGTWKFNAVGNGVAKDLAGLCAFYGVQVDG